MSFPNFVRSASLNGVEKTQGRESLVVGSSSLAIIASLVLGVGFGSHLVLRHVVQTLPLWVPVALGFRRSRAAGWAGLPVFLFWFILMVLIWFYLLGMSKMLSGHFTPLEIVMTMVVGIASVVGIWAFLKLKSLLPRGRAAVVFLLITAVQFICFRLSFLPSIAHR